MDWEEFEDIARDAIQKEFGCTLSNGTVDITGKSKNFDLVNEGRIRCWKRYQVIQSQ